MASSSNPSLKPARVISPVWIIPLVALLVGGWLSVQGWQARGVEVELVFENASGIEVGKTEIRLKDVPVGRVTGVRLNSDLSKVHVFAAIDRNLSRHVGENTRFWLVSPRVSASGISNLGTLISGVFIVMDPGKPGASASVFEALPEPPPFKSDDLGTQFILTAETLGSIGVGSPVYYKQLKVGEVTGYRLGQRGDYVEVRVFIEAPHDRLVLTRSRFWNVSGFDVSIGADGLKAQMASVASLISGGIAFENVVGFEAPQKAEGDHVFFLYDDRASVMEERYNLKYFYRLRFSHSVRGLSVGAPVEFRGLKVGVVEDIVLNSVADAPQSLHVYISLEPQRLDADVKPSRDDFDSMFADLVDRGLRAQLKTGSLLTGSKYIDLLFPPEVAAGQLVRSEHYSEIPTLDHPMDQLDQQVADIAAQVNQIPLAELGQELTRTLASLSNILAVLDESQTAQKLDATLHNVSLASEQLDATMGELQKSLAQMTVTLQSVDASLAPDSATQYELTETLQSVRQAAESLRSLTNTLNRKPNALIFGRGSKE